MSKKCLNCGEEIKVRVWIDGKLRNFQRRKYCLKCSPFGQHNTSKYYAADCLQRECKHHGLTEYVKRPNGNFRCKKCRAEDTTEQRLKRKLKLIQVMGGKCELCGYNKCARALHFHHGDPKNKIFSLSEACYQFAFDRLLAEINKCVLLCSNCHSEIEDGMTELPTHLIDRCKITIDV